MWKRRAVPENNNHQSPHVADRVVLRTADNLWYWNEILSTLRRYDLRLEGQQDMDQPAETVTLTPDENTRPTATLRAAGREYSRLLKERRSKT